MTDIVKRLRARRAMWLNGLRYCMSTEPDIDCAEAADEIERLRAVITRAKDALLDGQSTQWVHDLLVSELTRRALENKP